MDFQGANGRTETDRRLSMQSEPQAPLHRSGPISGDSGVPGRRIDVWVIRAATSSYYRHRHDHQTGLAACRLLSWDFEPSLVPAPMQSLEVFQSLWSMERRQPGVRELALAEVFEQIAAANFAGIALDTGTRNSALYDQAQHLLREHNLGCIVTAFPDSVEDMKQVLDVCAQVDARFACINAQVFPLTPVEGAEFVAECLELGRQWQMPVYFETHRLTLTTDLLYTLQVLELVPELELVCDLSHYVVARELPNPVDDFWQDLMRQVMQRGAAFQGRVASREQVQVPIHFAQHQYWYELFQQWWAEGFDLWRKRKGKDDTLNFLCELGPAPYAITDADGFDLTDRWSEALDIKAKVEQIWADG